MNERRNERMNRTSKGKRARKEETDVMKERNERVGERRKA